MEDKTIRISGDTHAALVRFTTAKPHIKIGKFVEVAVMEKIVNEDIKDTKTQKDKTENKLS